MADHSHGHGDHAHHAHHDDRGAAFTGLIVGGILLFAILFGVTKATNAKFAHEKGEAHAGETK